MLRATGHARMVILDQKFVKTFECPAPKNASPDRIERPKRQIMRVEILCSETSHIIHHSKDLSEGC